MLMWSDSADAAIPGHTAAWRVADSMSLRKFLGYALDEQTPDHSTMSRTRRLFWVETHKAIFRWVLKILIREGLLQGQTVSVDATTLAANAAMRHIVRRDNGQTYNDYLKDLARAAGMENPTREQLARLDRKWTHLPHKAEHAVDLSSGAGCWR
jgi:transposase